MKKKILGILGGAIVFFLVVALLKDFLYDTPQRCATVYSNTLEGSAQRPGIDYLCVYRINYMSLVSLGTLTMSRREKEEGPVFSAEAKSEGSLADLFVHASARIESYFDKQTDMPYRYSETTLVNEHRKSKDIEFDRVAGIADREGYKTRISEDIYDPVGAFVAALKQPYQDSREYIVKLLSKETVYVLKTRKVHDSKEFSQIAIDVGREDMTSTHGVKMMMWITNGPARIPILFKSWTPVGYMSVVLEKIEVVHPGISHGE